MTPKELSRTLDNSEDNITNMQTEADLLEAKPVQSPNSPDNVHSDKSGFHPIHRRQILKKVGIAVAGLMGLSATLPASPALAGTTSTSEQPSLTLKQNFFDLAANSFIKFRGGIDAKQYRRKGRDMEGTIFPSNSEAGDRYFRTDRGIEYYFDSTNWLSLNPFYVTMAYNPNAFSRPLTTSFIYYQIISNPETNYSIYIESFTLISSVTQFFDANNYWQLEIRRFSDDNVGVQQVLKSIYQPDRLLDRHYVDVIPVNTVYSKDSFKSFALNWTRTGNPGGLSDQPVTIKYRLVG